MRNSKEHAQRLQKLYRGLKRAHTKVARPAYEDPAEALICGILSEKMSESSVSRALRDIRRAFVDWNDLRVSRPEEIIEALGGDSPASRAAALSLTTALRGVFDEHHKISLQALRTQGKRPARQDLERLDGVSRFVVNYCMLTALQAHAIPLTKEMVEYLQRHGIIEPEACQDEIEAFLTRQIAAKDAYEFYALLRRESESPKVFKVTRSKTRSRGRKATRR
jgi:endonuclease III